MAKFTFDLYKAQYQALGRLYTWCTGEVAKNNTSPEFIEMTRRMRRLQQIMSMMIETNGNPPYNFSDNLKAAYSHLAVAANAFGQAAVNNQTPKIDVARFHAIQDSGILKSLVTAYRPLCEVYTSRDTYVRQFAEGKTADNVKKQYGETSSFGHRPSLEECLTLKVGESEPALVFDRLLWLESMQESAKALGAEPAAIFNDCRTRLISELKSADVKTQMTYAQMIAHHKDAVSHAANGAYTVALEDPVNAQNPALGALTALSGNPDYLGACGVESLINDLGPDTSVSGIINGLQNPVDFPGLSTRPDVARIKALTGDGLQAAITQQGGRPEDVTACKQQLASSAAASGYAGDDFTSRVGAFYTRLSGETGTESQSFNRVRDTFSAFAGQNHKNPENPDAYRSLLIKANDAMRGWLSQHRRRHFRSADTVRRHDVITEMQGVLDTRLTQIEERRRQTRDNNVQAIVGSENFKRTPPELMRLARARRAIGASRLIPKQVDTTLEPSALGKAGLAIRKGLNWLFAYTTGAVLGGIWWLGAKIFTRVKKNRHAPAHNIEQVPGLERGAKLEPLTTEGGPNQPIAADCRRVPFAFEKEIPEDPNQPPKITFEVQQGKEGSTDMWPKDPNREAGDGKWDMGHGFVSMEYSRPDPFTGQMRRYRSAFGFYPKGGFSSKKMSAANMILKNGLIPGTLTDDFDHLTSVGKTIIATNEQINRLAAAAEDYEKGGYGFTNRNCVSFVREMAATVGLDTDKFFTKSDLNTGFFSSAGLTTIIAFGALPISGRQAERNLRAGQEKTDLSYQKHGETLITEADIEVLSKREYLSDMKTYSPSRTGEAIRRDAGFTLHSRQYKGKATDVSQEARDNDPVGSCYKVAQAESLRLIADVKSVIDTRRDEAGQPVNMTRELEALGEYCSTCLEAIGADVKIASQKKLDKEGKPVRVSSFAEREPAYFGATKSINEMIEGLNEIYDVTFKKDPQLNIAFQHMVSTLEHTKHALGDEYRGMKNEMTFKPMLTVGDYQFMRGKVDLTRGAADALYRYRFKSVQLETGRKRTFYPNDLAIASMMAYGDLKTASNCSDRLDELNDAEELTSEEKSERTKLTLKSDLAEHYVNANKVYAGKKSFTHEELNLFFKTLTAAEMKSGFEPGEDLPSETLKCLALEKVIGNITQELTEIIAGALNGLNGTLRNVENMPEFGDCDSAKDLQRQFVTTDAADAAADRICDLLDRKLSAHSEDVKFMVNAYKEGLKDKFASIAELMDLVPGTAEYEQTRSAMALEQTIELIGMKYTAPVISSVLENLEPQANGIDAQYFKQFSDTLHSVLSKTSMGSAIGVAKLSDNLNQTIFGKDPSYLATCTDNKKAQAENRQSALKKCLRDFKAEQERVKQKAAKNQKAPDEAQKADGGQKAPTGQQPGGPH